MKEKQRHFEQVNTEIICHQPTNVKRNTRRYSSGNNKIITEGSSEMQETTQSNGNGKYANKFNEHLQCETVIEMSPNFHIYIIKMNNSYSMKV